MHLFVSVNLILLYVTREQSQLEVENTGGHVFKKNKKNNKAPLKYN